LVLYTKVFSQETNLIIGTYTSGKSEGIYVYKFNTATAENKLVSVAKTSNPSFLTVKNNFVYAVNENADTVKNTYGGSVTAFSFDSISNTLTPINKVSSGGENPCFISVTENGKYIYVANYTSGTAGVISVNNDGSLNKLVSVITHTGNSIDVQRQQSPHIHATVISPNEKYLYVSDLGIDKLMVYKINKRNGTLKLTTEAPSTAGSGPRHVSIHPNNKFIYLMEELTGTVVCYKVKKNKLNFVKKIHALDINFKGIIGSADIHVSLDGKFLYCSNRGASNTISIFKINEVTGELTFLQEQSTLGEKPRNFNFDPTGNFLLVANQISDNIVVFKIDKLTGLLTDTGKRIEVPNPVCIKFIK
jgi:6-phosphogluconolactonase